MVSSEKSKDAKWWIHKLSKKGIGARPFFYPMHLQKCLSGSETLSTQYSEKLAKNGFYIPSGLTLSEKQIEYISNAFLNETE